MNNIYAQVVNGMVNLIGGEEVGLPFNNEIAMSIDISDVPENERPQEGWYYRDGVFSQITPIPPTPEPTEIEVLRLEQAQSNVEMIDLIMAMLGGV